MHYDKPIYNEEFKLKFLDTYIEEESKRHRNMVAFRKSYDMEKSLQKDIYDFTAKELDDFFSGAMFQSIASARNTISAIKEYVMICIVEGFSNLKSDRNFSLAMKDVEKYVYSNMKTVYTLEEIEYAFKKDSDFRYLMAVLMFHGVGSIKFAEIQTLTVENLVNNGDLFYVELDNRKVEIPKELYSRLTDYNNVSHDPRLKFDFIKTDTIFKPFNRTTKRISNTHVLHSTKNTMFATAKEVLNDETICMRTVKRSGCTYYAYKYMQESGSMTLTLDILKKVADRYGMARNVSGYYYYKILEDINLDFIRKEYGNFDIDYKVSERLRNND